MKKLTKKQIRDGMETFMLVFALSTAVVAFIAFIVRDVPNDLLALWVLWAIPFTWITSFWDDPFWVFRKR